MPISPTNYSRKFVKKVSDMPDLQHAAVRIGLWLTEAAEQNNGFPVDAHQPTNFIAGMRKGGITMKGIAFRPETVHRSITALQEAGLLTVTEGTTVRAGHISKLYTLHLD